MKPNKTAIVGIVANLMIFIAKFMIGILINSIAIVADAFNNLGDILSNIVVIAGYYFSKRPADDEHPFGHERVEYLSALIISFLMFFTGFQFLVSSFKEIIEPTHMGFHPVVLFILCMTIGGKVGLSIYYHKSALALNSSPLKALATDSRNDVILTTFTVISLVIAYVTSINLDGYFGSIISLFIIYSAYTVSRETISKLLGEAVDGETAKKIQSFVMSYENILGTHDLIVHTYGPKRTMATLHVDMSNELLLEEAHNIIDKIERDIKREMDINLVLHIDPVAVEDARYPILKNVVTNYIQKIHEHIELHDFRIIDKGSEVKIIFELVFPHAFDKDKESIVTLSLESIIKTMDATYHPIIETKYKFIRE